MEKTTKETAVTHYLVLDLALANVGWVLMNSRTMKCTTHGTFTNNKQHDLEAHDIPYRVQKLLEFADYMMDNYELEGIIFESIFHGKDKRAAIAMGSSLALIGYFRHHYGADKIHHISAQTMKEHILLARGEDPKKKAKEFAKRKLGWDMPEHEADAFCIWDAWRVRNISTNPFD